MTAPIRTVAIVDDQELIRTGFSLILESADDLTVMGEASDGEAALALLAEAAASDQLPDVMLMDVRMPGMDGITATQAVVRKYPSVRVLVLTTFDLDEYALDAVAAGASGFLLKDARAGELINAVRTIADGDSVISPQVTRRLLLRLHNSTVQPVVSEDRGVPSRPGDTAPSAQIPRDRITASHRERDERLAPLTERELQVFTLIAEGLSNAEIGSRLFLSESTVKTHVGRVLAKLSLRDRVHAVILAFEIAADQR